MERLLYIPIVKGKPNSSFGVARAMYALGLPVKPVVEMLPISEQSEKSVEQHVFQFCSLVKKNFPLGELSVDFYGPLRDQLSDGTPAVRAGFQLLMAMDRPVTPVYGFGRDDDLWEPLGTLARQMCRGFCFRVSRDDLESYSPDEVWTQLFEAQERLRLPTDQCDLLIDLRAVEFHHLDSLQELVTDLLTQEGTYVSSLRTLSISGSSALMDVSDVPEEGSKTVTRTELYLWSRLWRDLPWPITYSDYGIVHPDYRDGGSSDNMNAKIRYTVGDRICYFRGHGLIKPKKDYEQYHAIASRVRDNREFLGRSFSFGDRRVDDCAQRRVKPGWPGEWVKADMNHHVHYVAGQQQLLTRLLHEELNEEEAQRLLTCGLEFAPAVIS